MRMSAAFPASSVPFWESSSPASALAQRDCERFQGSGQALLKFRPSLPGVDYDTPADEATRNACKVETVVNAQNKSIGYALRDAQGRCCAGLSAQGKRMDQWSYYQDGFEVYREDDLNGDHTSTNAAGSTPAARGSPGRRGKIKAWKQISAEEASKVLVQALVAGDAALLETVMATPAELAARVCPRTSSPRSRQRPDKRAEQVAAFRSNWSAGTPRRSGTGSTARFPT